MTSYPTSKENTLDNYTEIDKIQSKQDNIITPVPT